MASPAETDAMRRAIAVAHVALGTSNPNPAVGAVVLDRAGNLAGEGATSPPGGPHAEVVALAVAGAAASGGCLIVTLEPCAHHGRTGPCAEAAIDAGVARVIYAVTDPHDLASGGAQRLRQAGIEVEAGVLEAEAGIDLQPWLSAVRTHRPFVTWKYAATLDGRTAAPDGSSRWITGEAAREDVHVLRSRADAVVAGIGTVLADDPALTARIAGAQRQPLRVVVDSDARTPLGAQVLDGAADTLIAVAEDAPADRVEMLRDVGAEVVELSRTSTGLDLKALLDALYARERYLVLLEGGATLAAGFLRAGLLDRVIGYVAPALLGDGSPVLNGFGIPTISEASRLVLSDVSALGGDVRIVADFQRSADFQASGGN